MERQSRLIYELRYIILHSQVVGTNLWWWKLIRKLRGLLKSIRGLVVAELTRNFCSSRHLWWVWIRFIRVSEEFLIVLYQLNLVVLKHFQVGIVQFNEVAHVAELVLYFSSYADLFTSFGQIFWNGGRRVSRGNHWLWIGFLDDCFPNLRAKLRHCELSVAREATSVFGKLLGSVSDLGHFNFLYLFSL